MDEQQAMPGGQGRLPCQSNCKGPARAAVCSHSFKKDMTASILPAFNNSNGDSRSESVKALSKHGQIS